MSATDNDLDEQEPAEAGLSDCDQRLRCPALQLALTQERERRRIAAGLHDEVGQLLAVARMKLGKLMQTGARGEVAAQAMEIDELLDRAIAETRSLTFELSSPVLHELGLGAAVESLCDALGEQSGVRFSVEFNLEPSSLSEELRILLYRAVRELCANVVKHARAPRADVYLHIESDRIWVVVDDNGKGFDRSKPLPAFDQQGGFGLFGIREMASQIGASFEIDSAPGNGTLAALVVPLA